MTTLEKQTYVTPRTKTINPVLTEELMGQGGLQGSIPFSDTDEEPEWAKEHTFDPIVDTDDTDNNSWE